MKKQKLSYFCSKYEREQQQQQQNNFHFEIKSAAQSSPTPFHLYCISIPYIVICWVVLCWAANFELANEYYSTLLSFQFSSTLLCEAKQKTRVSKKL